MLRLVLALLAVLALAGCRAEEEPAAQRGGAGPLPDVPVVDLADGRTFSLAEVEPGGNPLLVWFWAPH